MQFLQERLQPRIEHRGAWHRLRRCSRLKPLLHDQRCTSRSPDLQPFFTLNHAAYNAGRNSSVSTVATINPPMIATAIGP